MAIRLGNRKILTLDWDRKNLRVAVAQLRGTGVELLKAVTVPILPDVDTTNAESFGTFIRESLRKARITGKNAIISVPREKVVLNTINLPPAPAEELPAMVINQVARELPFAADQAVIDFALSSDHDPKSAATALVAAVRIEDVAFYQKVASSAGLTLERIGLRPFANRHAVLSTLDRHEDKTVLIVELGPVHSEISVVYDGTLKFSRSAMTAIPDLRAEAEREHRDSRIQSLAVQDVRSSEKSRESVSAIMVEVIRSFEAYKATEASASVDRIVVCGATGLEAELSQSLAARFAALAELFNPAKALAIEPERAKELRGFSAVLGLAMSHGRHPLSSFDFLAPKKPISRRTRRMKKAPKIVLTSVFLIAAAITAWFNFVNPALAEVRTLDKEIQELQPKKKPLETFGDRVEALHAWTQAEQYWPDELVRLTDAIPPSNKAQVTRVAFDTKLTGRKKSQKYVSTVEIRLRTSELGVVNEISEVLRKELGYKDVAVGSETPIRGRNDSVYKFDTKIDAVIPERKHEFNTSGGNGNATNDLEETDPPEDDVDTDAAIETAIESPIVVEAPDENAPATADVTDENAATTPVNVPTDSRTPAEIEQPTDDSDSDIEGAGDTEVMDPAGGDDSEEVDSEPAVEEQPTETPELQPDESTDESQPENAPVKNDASPTVTKKIMPPKNQPSPKTEEAPSAADQPKRTKVRIKPPSSNNRGAKTPNVGASPNKAASKKSEAGS